MYISALDTWNYESPRFPTISIAYAKHRPQCPESDDCERSIDARDGTAEQQSAEGHGARPPERYTARQSEKVKNGQANPEGQQHQNRKQERKSSGKPKMNKGTGLERKTKLAPKQNCQKK